MQQRSCRIGPVMAFAAGIVVLSWHGLAAAAAEVPISFYNITHNSPTAAAEGEAKLSVALSDLGGGRVRFLFANRSTATLTDVYFDDGSLLSIASISSSPGVNFSQGAAPPNLPGHNALTPGFQVSAGFSADSDAPVSLNGVTMNEWLAIDFTLKSGKTYADTFAALALPNGGGSGDLRIGVHVQGYAGGSSESFVNLPLSPVPEPEAALMLLAGLAIIGRRAGCGRRE